MDPFGPPLPGWREKLTTALAVGGDVEITVGEFVAHLGKNPKDNPLLQLVRTDPQGYTQAQIAEHSEILDELLLSEVELAKKKGLAPTKRVETTSEKLFPEMEQVKKQLTEIGFHQKAIDHYTTTLNQMFVTLGKRLEQDPNELFKEYGFEVARGLSNVVGSTPQALVDLPIPGINRGHSQGEPSRLASAKS